MSFFRSLLGLDEERNRRIDNHILEVKVKISIQNEAEMKFNKVWEKLTEKQKKKVDKIFKLVFGKIMFPTRVDWLDTRRYLAEDELKQPQPKEVLK